MHREEQGAGKLEFTAKDFKVCDLCGALNRIYNSKCFVCSWHGLFHTDSETVMRTIEEFGEEHGGISEALIAEEILSDSPLAPQLVRQHN